MCRFEDKIGRVERDDERVGGGGEKRRPALARVENARAVRHVDKDVRVGKGNEEETFVLVEEEWAGAGAQLLWGARSASGSGLGLGEVQAWMQ